MEWKPYILFPNEAQEWQTAPLGLSYGCLQVEATGPSQATLSKPAGDTGPGETDSLCISVCVFIYIYVLYIIFSPQAAENVSANI